MRESRVCGYDLWVSDVMADWDAIAQDSDWERERIASIMETMQPGDVLFDIGVEHAWMSAIFATQVGGQNMVLVEPSAAFWPTIRQTWEHNGFKHPYCFDGYAGRTTTTKRIPAKRWPLASVGEETHEFLPYKHMVHHHGIPMMKVDRMTHSSAHPVGITIDVEGAELEVLTGARWTLANVRPHIWLSLHPDMLLRDFNAHVDELFKLLFEFDYRIEILGVDHETHVYAEPR